MSLYLLDTDILTLFQKGHPTVLRNASVHSAGDIALPVVAVEGQLTGWYTRLRQAKRDDELADVYTFLTEAIRFIGQINVVTFSLLAVQRYRQLCKTHRALGKNDLRNAATAIVHYAILVTRNKSDFQRIPGLVIEDWSQ